MKILAFLTFLFINIINAVMHESHCDSSEWFVYKNFCLSISKLQYTWKDAEKYCKSQSATMVKIEDESKFKFLQNHSSSNFQYVWVNLQM